MSQQWKRVITINNSSGTAQTDYQVLVVWDSATEITAGRIDSGLNSLRFRDPGTGEYFWHWVEPQSRNSTSCRTWVKIPNLPASTIQIHMIYGDSSLPNVESLANTFITGEDFSGTPGTNIPSTIWTHRRGTWKYQSDSGVIAAKPDETTDVRLLAEINDISDVIVTSRMRVTGGSAKVGVFARCTLDVATTFGYGYAGESNNNTVSRRICRASGGTLTMLSSVSGWDFSYRAYSLKCVGTTLHFFQDGSLVTQTTDSTYSTGKIGLVANQASGASYFDWIVVGKAQAIDPPVSIGSLQYLGPVIYSVNPNRLYQRSYSAIEVTGENFQSGLSAQFEKSGQSPVQMTNITVNSSTKFIGDVDFENKALGLWNLRVTNP